MLANDPTTNISTLPGRGAWKQRGMPPGVTMYLYTAPTPVGSLTGTIHQTDLDSRAVHNGVIAIQTRINKLGFHDLGGQLKTDGIYGPRTAWAAASTQRQLGVIQDGVVGPITMRAMMWPVIKDVVRVQKYQTQVAQIVGGVSQHESAYDPGAVGELDSDDLGLVQINLPANTQYTEPECFNYRTAYEYAAGRIQNALTHYTNRDAAICSYFIPLWADQWQQTGQPPNQDAQNFVQFVKNWEPPA